MKRLDPTKKLLVIQYVSKGAQGHEIELAVKSWYKYCKNFETEWQAVSIGEQIPGHPEIPCIAGDKEDLTSAKPCRAQHIHVARDLYDVCYICNNTPIEDFVLTSDDFFAIRPFDWNDLAKPRYNDDASIDWTGNPSVVGDPHFWSYAKYKTIQMLIKSSYGEHITQSGRVYWDKVTRDWKHSVQKTRNSTLDFTTHAPAVYHVQWLEFIINHYQMTDPPNDYTFEDIYGNWYWNPERHNGTTANAGEPQALYKASDFRVRITRPAQRLDVIDWKAEKGAMFANCSVNGWSPEFEDKIRSIVE